jgi:hypothetical protein
MAVALATVGGVVATRHPRNPVGWLLGAAGLVLAVVAFAEEYAAVAVVARPGSLPLGTQAAWLVEWWPLSVAAVAGVFSCCSRTEPWSPRAGGRWPGWPRSARFWGRWGWP